MLRISFISKCTIPWDLLNYLLPPLWIRRGRLLVRPARLLRVWISEGLTQADS